jgi:hypothetical protein
MAGSGTTLVEARLMKRHSVGYDIDPLARLIAQVKSRTVNGDKLDEAFERVVRKARRDLLALKSRKASAAVRERATPPDFYNHDYWFDPSVSVSLAILSHHIGETAMADNVRDFLWVAFSSLILAKTSVANARDIIHSRHHYWQHAQTPDVLEKFTTRVRLMRRQMAGFDERCGGARVRSEARLGDARRLRLRDETIDLVFTSPPYATALDYPRAHFLAVAWMKKALGIDLQDYLAKASAYVGSERGRMPGDFAVDEHLSRLDLTSSVLTQLAERSMSHAKRVQRYFVDMRQVFGEIARLLRSKRHAIIVVCPSHLRRVEIPTHEVLIEMGRACSLKLKWRHTRTIYTGRRILPYMQEAFGKRMDTEYVLVFQKKS